jgi:hypothetical protein
MLETTTYYTYIPLTLLPCASAYPPLLMRHSIMVWADATSCRDAMSFST